MTSPRGRHNSRSRRFTETLANALVKGWITRLSYRCGLHGTLRTTQLDIQIPAEKGLAKPLTLAFVSDFHAGPTTYPDVFTTMRELLIAAEPDVILLGGDYVTGEATSVKVLTDALSQCKPPLGMYAVLGNHDLWADDEHLKRQLSAAGATILLNSNRALPPPFNNVSICGIDDPWTGNVDMLEAFAGAGPIRIFMTHSPDGLLFLGQEKFDVGFAGHTHGGQVAFRDGTPVMSACGPLSRAYSAGRFDIEGNGILIVGRGVGCSNLPIRWNADPEIILCTLRPGNAGA